MNSTFYHIASLHVVKAANESGDTQRKDMSGSPVWTPYTDVLHHHSCSWTFLCVRVSFNLLTDDDLCHWLRLTCPWVILTMTEGGKGVWCMMHQSNFITVMNGAIRLSLPPPLFYSHAEMTNYTLVSHCLMNIKCQVCDVCVCVRTCRDRAERLQRKLGKAFCYNLSLTSFHRSHPCQHSHTYGADFHTHTHTFAHILPATYWADAALSCFIALSLSLSPSPVTQGRDPSCHRHRYE